MVKKQPQLSVRSDSTTQWFRVTSGVVGGILLGLAGLWLAWLLLHQFAGNTIPAPPIISAFPTSPTDSRSEEHTSELQSRFDLVCRLLLEKKKHRIVYNS